MADQLECVAEPDAARDQPTRRGAVRPGQDGVEVVADRLEVEALADASIERARANWGAQASDSRS